MALYSAALWTFNLTPHWAEGRPMPPDRVAAEAAAVSVPAAEVEATAGAPEVAPETAHETTDEPTPEAAGMKRRRVRRRQRGGGPPREEDVVFATTW